MHRMSTMRAAYGGRRRLFLSEFRQCKNSLERHSQSLIRLRSVTLLAPAFRTHKVRTKRPRKNWPWRQCHGALDKLGKTKAVSKLLSKSDDAVAAQQNLSKANEALTQLAKSDDAVAAQQNLSKANEALAQLKIKCFAAEHL